ncbi:MAG TPA: MATE family efflux transporter [Gemmatimonadaceae bacterium]
MQDLTTGSVTRHLLKTTSFMLVTMVFQTLYFLIDLYWVGRLGTDAVAAVGIAGNLTFIVLALTQMLGVGTTTLVSHAVGRKDHDAANMMFNQSQVLATLVGVAFLIIALVARVPFTRAQSADAETARLAASYLLWFIPAMALQFLLVSMGAALRGVGNFKPTMIVSSATVVLNMILAPFLIFGWGTGRPFGVAGAAISSLVAIIVGIVWMTRYFRGDSFLHFIVADWKPKFAAWKRMIAIGVPSGVEFILMAVYIAIVYSVARPFGAAAQAGFGIGGRVIQALFMPSVALGFSVAPVAGQNFGARQRERVIDTYKHGAAIGCAIMFVLTILCHLLPRQMVSVFSNDPAAIDTGAEYLTIISYNFLASGLIFVNASMFQAMGNTIPSLITSSLRIILVAIPVLIIARMPGFSLTQVWYLSVFAVFVQLIVSVLLLRREFSRRLAFPAPDATPAIPASAVSA